MKLLLLTLFVATAFAVPVPLDDEDGGPVELIVNGVAEGDPLEIGNVLGIHVNEHVDGVIASSTNLLHPLTAVGIAEAAAAAEAANADNADDSFDVVVPVPVVMPPPSSPEVVIPQPVVIPEIIARAPIILSKQETPDVVVPEPVVLPAPSKPEVSLPVIPNPVVLPAPPKPEVVIPEAEDVPVAAPQSPNGEVFNNGLVQVTVNAPQEAGVFATLQSWMNLVINYFTDAGPATQQIV